MMPCSSSFEASDRKGSEAVPVDFDETPQNGWVGSLFFLNSRVPASLVLSIAGV